MTYSLDDARGYEQAHDDLKAAEIYEALGQLERAKALYLKIERKHPFQKKIKFQLGRLLTRMQEWDAAIQRLQEVSDVGTFLEESLYLLAECFQHKGLIYAAKEIYVELLGRNYQYKDARAKLQALEAPGFSRLTSLQRTAVGSPAAVDDDRSQTLQGIPLEDRYLVIEEIGRGGMGIVYKAEEKPSRRVVAIKVLPPYLANDSMSRLRFFREAEIVAQLHHPHLVQILETNQAGNFIVMEYVAGGTLHTWQSQHPAALNSLLLFIVHILDALHVVHEQGIIHRDLKPDNILIADDHTAKLTDFGIAHICGATITHTGTHLGTLPYMSPEQVLGSDLDRRSDIYSVGVMLYELLTGVLPFTGSETSYHHIHTRPRPPCELTPELSPELNAIILSCLAKSPADRYPDAQAVSAAIQHYLSC